MSKRKYLRNSVIAILATFALVISSQASIAAPKVNNKKLTVWISADVNIKDLWEKTLIPAFVKKNPSYSVSIVHDVHGSRDAQTVAKLTAATIQKKDPGFDLWDGGQSYVLGQSGLLTTANIKLLKNLKHVSPTTLRAGAGAIPYRGSSVLLAYNPAKVSAPPRSVDDLITWIRNNPGQFAYNTPGTGGSGDSFVMTVLARYASAAAQSKLTQERDVALYTEWNRGFDVLGELHDKMFSKGTYPNGNAAVLALLSSGQISMAPVWSDQFATGQRNGTIPANFRSLQLTTPGFTGGAAYMGIPRGTPRQAGALVLANWVLGKEAQELIVNAINGYPVRNLAKMDPAVVDKFKEANIDNLRAPYIATVVADMRQQWTAKVASK